MIEIKSEYHETAVAFGNSGSVLSKRTQSELVDLAIMAHESKNPNLLKFFVNIPSVDDLRKMKLGEKIEQYKKTTNKPNKVETKKK